MSKLIESNYFRVTLGVVVAIVALVSSAKADETIAWWRFDTANPWADSSGNGYDLLSLATSVSEDFDGTGVESEGSVYFNGLDNWAASMSSVDLTGCEAVRLSWWQKVDSTALGVVMEQSSSYYTNDGGIVVAVNDVAEGIGSTGIWVGSPHTELLPHTNGAWEHYSIEYWPTANYAADVVKVYKDGVLQQDGEAYPNTHPLGSPDSFVNDVFYFGARNAGEKHFFEGNLDEVKLESFTPQNTSETPEPYTNILAQWNFNNSANRGEDTSGNGHDLEIIGGSGAVDPSGSQPPGVSGVSMLFKDIADGMMKTEAPLDLSPYSSIQISWWQWISASSSADTLFASSDPSTTSGGFCAMVNTGGAGGTGIFEDTGTVDLFNGTAMNETSFTHTCGEERTLANQTWDQMLMVIDLDADSNSTVTKVYRGGNLVSTSVVASDAPLSFANDYFYVGNQADGTAPMYGYIDELTIAVKEASPNIPGDANKDGKVDGSDVTILAGNWQVGVDPSDTTEVTWAMGDFNGDGQVDGSDVTILAGNWQAGVEASAASVPEPSTLVLLLVGAISFLALRRDK